MKTTIFTLCILALIAQGYGADDSLHSENYADCFKELNIKEEDLKTMEEKGDPKALCLMACMVEKDGYVKNGDFDEETMKNDILSDYPQVDNKKVSEIIDTCVEIGKRATEKCEKIGVTAYCISAELEKEDSK